MSLVLRHNPGTLGMELDENGWLAIDALVAGMSRKGVRADKEIIFEVVRTNDKQRFTISEDKCMVRANQGHSVQVDVELQATEPLEFLFHGTVEKFMPNILETGITKQSRLHVHLSKDVETANVVGARRGKPLLLRIQALRMFQDGHEFFLSENEVWLTDHVPPEYIEQSW